MRTAHSLTVSRSIWHGGCTFLGGGVPARGVYLPRGCTCLGGVPAWGVSAGGGVPARGMGYLPGGVYLPRYSPRGQNSWHTLLKILPCPNFVAGGKYAVKQISGREQSLWWLVRELYEICTGNYRSCMGGPWQRPPPPSSEFRVFRYLIFTFVWLYHVICTWASLCESITSVC